MNDYVKLFKEEFLRLTKPDSLRKYAKKAEVSFSYTSQMLNGERPITESFVEDLIRIYPEKANPSLLYELMCRSNGNVVFSLDEVDEEMIERILSLKKESRGVNK